VGKIEDLARHFRGQGGTTRETRAFSVLATIREGVKWLFQLTDCTAARF